MNSFAQQVHVVCIMNTFALTGVWVKENPPSMSGEQRIRCSAKAASMAIKQEESTGKPPPPSTRSTSTNP